MEGIFITASSSISNLQWNSTSRRLAHGGSCQMFTFTWKLQTAVDCWWFLCTIISVEISLCTKGKCLQKRTPRKYIVQNLVILLHIFSTCRTNLCVNNFPSYFKFLDSLSITAQESCLAGTPTTRLTFNLVQFARVQTTNKYIILKIGVGISRTQRLNDYILCIETIFFI